MWEQGAPTGNPGIGNTPGGAPIQGLLDLLNMFQANKLRGQAVAQQQQSEAEQVSKNATSGIFGTDQGQQMAQDLGLNPDTTSQIVSSNPQMQLRTALAAKRPSIRASP